MQFLLNYYYILDWENFEPQSARSEISDVSDLGGDLFSRVDGRVDGLGFKNLHSGSPKVAPIADGFSLFFPQVNM